MSMYSSYTDLNNVIKENIVVGHKKEDRITNQKIRFFNRENEYWGIFEGVVNTNEAYITGGEITGVQLNDCSIRASTGNKIDLTYIADDIEDLQNDVRLLSSNTINAVVQSNMAMKFGGVIPISSNIMTFAELFSIANDMIGLSGDIAKNQIFQIKCADSLDKKFLDIDGNKIYESDFIIVKNSTSAKDMTSGDITIIKQIDISDFNSINDKINDIENKIDNRLKNIIVISQEEYDNIGDEKNTDDQLYFIYDENDSEYPSEDDNSDEDDNSGEDDTESDNICDD